MGGNRNYSLRCSSFKYCKSIGSLGKVIPTGTLPTMRTSTEVITSSVRNNSLRRLEDGSNVKRDQEFVPSRLREMDAEWMVVVAWRIGRLLHETPGIEVLAHHVGIRTLPRQGKN